MWRQSNRDISKIKRVILKYRKNYLIFTIYVLNRPLCGKYYSIRLYKLRHLVQRNIHGNMIIRQSLLHQEIVKFDVTIKYLLFNKIVVEITWQQIKDKLVGNVSRDWVW